MCASPVLLVHYVNTVLQLDKYAIFARSSRLWATDLWVIFRWGFTTGIPRQAAGVDEVQGDIARRAEL